MKSISAGEKRAIILMFIAFVPLLWVIVNSGEVGKAGLIYSIIFAGTIGYYFINQILEGGK
jgi:hypothetical protein